MKVPSLRSCLRPNHVIRGLLVALIGLIVLHHCTFCWDYVKNHRTRFFLSQLNMTSHPFKSNFWSPKQNPQDPANLGGTHVSRALKQDVEKNTQLPQGANDPVAPQEKTSHVVVSGSGSSSGQQVNTTEERKTDGKKNEEREKDREKGKPLLKVDLQIDVGGELRTSSKNIIHTTQPQQLQQPAAGNSTGKQETVAAVAGSALPSCDDIPLKLVGKMNVSQNEVTDQEMQRMFPSIQRGGHWSPTDCRPTHKLAILIPFRGRHAHLHVLLPNLIPMLMRQRLDFTIFVIEQDEPTPFNKGVVNNAGFLEALKIDKNFDCFIFHDVDMLPLNDMNTYTCNPKGPTHYMAGLNKFKYRLIYDWLLGGVIGFTKGQYEMVNGYSNLYFGWGGEDDDMYDRIRVKKLRYHRANRKYGLYDMIKHKRDKGWEPTQTRFLLRRSSTRRVDQDGLRNVKYHLTKTSFKPLYTWINVYVNATAVYQDAPDVIKHLTDRIVKEYKSVFGTRLQGDFIQPIV